VPSRGTGKRHDMRYDVIHVLLPSQIHSSQFIAYLTAPVCFSFLITRPYHPRLAAARPQAAPLSLTHTRETPRLSHPRIVRGCEIPRHLPPSTHASPSSLHLTNPFVGHPEHDHHPSSSGGTACSTTGPLQQKRTRGMSQLCPSHLILPPTGFARVKVWISQYDILYCLAWKQAERRPVKNASAASFLGVRRSQIVRGRNFLAKRAGSIEIK
jgi:hypothetical protein